MNDIVLGGCTPTPLASYLKALGVLRLVSNQADSAIRSYWRDSAFVIRSHLDREGFRNFFLDEYQPTPIISPWSGRAGFLEGVDSSKSRRKGAVTVRKILGSKGHRFRSYRKVFSITQAIPTVEALNHIHSEVKDLESKKRKKQPYDKERLKVAKAEEKKLKGQLLTALRARLPDSFLPWLDACLALLGDGMKPAPLLGSGGNEGSRDFSVNHVMLLLDLIDCDTDAPTKKAKKAIDNALFAVASPIALGGHPGFLGPCVAGGPNMGTGFSGGGGENPWNTVLMLEGALLMATTVSRRLDSTLSARLSFPFTVEALCAGNGGIASSESTRPEFWAPVWGAPTTLREVSALLAEGRSTVGRRQAENGLDMARSIAQLGVNRGLAAFHRFGLYERRGQGYYVASHLGRIQVPASPRRDWISELERYNWLGRFRRFSQGKNVSSRFVNLRRRLEDGLFELAAESPAPTLIQRLLTVLGEIEAALAVSGKARESVPPVPRLSKQWTQAADDGSAAFRIASALAGLWAGNEEFPLPLRAQLFPVHPRRNIWMDDARNRKAAGKDPALRLRLHTRPKGSLPVTLASLLSRRLWLAEQLELRDKPLHSPAAIGLTDLMAFLGSDHMDRRIGTLLPGLSLCSIPPYSQGEATGGAVPAAFALLRLCLVPDRVLRSLGLLGAKERLPVPPGLVAQLAAGNTGNRAVRLAWRRLRASGFSPIFRQEALPELGGIDALRAAAALLIPLRFSVMGELARSVLDVSETKTA